eukprot:8035611-Alexandrium_andersonii.AAC.1
MTELDDGRVCGESREDAVDPEFRELAATLNPLSGDEVSWVNGLVGSVARRAVRATEAEWKQWYSSIPQSLTGRRS